MRTTVFGDTVIESDKDDMGLVEALQDAGDNVYAVIREPDEETGKYDFEVMKNESGETVVSSDPIFDTQDAARTYLRGWIRDIQTD